MTQSTQIFLAIHHSGARQVSSHLYARFYHSKFCSTARKEEDQLRNSTWQQLKLATALLICFCVYTLFPIDSALMALAQFLFAACSAAIIVTKFFPAAAPEPEKYNPPASQLVLGFQSNLHGRESDAFTRPIFHPPR